MASSESLKMRAARPRGGGISAAETMVDLEQQIASPEYDYGTVWQDGLVNLPSNIAGLFSAQRQQVYRPESKSVVETPTGGFFEVTNPAVYGEPERGPGIESPAMRGLGYLSRLMAGDPATERQTSQAVGKGLAALPQGVTQMVRDLPRTAESMRQSAETGVKTVAYDYDEQGRPIEGTGAPPVLDPLLVMGAGAPQMTAAKLGKIPEGSLGVFGAYHGTKKPKRFPKFKLSPETAFTGEGAHAKGYGVYLAGAEGTAKTYQSSGPALPLPGGKWQLQRGTLYKVEVDADDHELLNWDRPISEQSDQVQAGIQKAFEDADVSDWRSMARYGPPRGPGLHRKTTTPIGDERITGQAAYKWLTEVMADKHRNLYSKKGRELEIEQQQPLHKNVAQQHASEALFAAGVPGLKFLDQLSRGKSLKELKEQRVARVNALDELRKNPPKFENVYYGASLTKFPDTKMREIFEQKQQNIIATKERQIASLDKMIAAEKPQTFNYVIFDDSLLEIVDEFSPEAFSNKPKGKNKGGYVMTGAETMIGLD